MGDTHLATQVEKLRSGKDPGSQSQQPHLLPSDLRPPLFPTPATLSLWTHRPLPCPSSRPAQAGVAQ